MAGQPTEAMLGIGALGLGTVLVLSAFKNVSPVALIKAAVTTGDLDLSKLPKIDSGAGSDGPPTGGTPDSKIPDDLKPIIDKIRAKDPQLGQNVSQGIEQVSPFLETSWTYARKQVKAAFDAGYINAIERARLEAEIVKRGAK